MHRDQVIPPTEDADQDPYAAGRPSLIREYLNTEPRKLLYSAGFIVGVMVVVTIPYVWLVGFDKWTNDMKEAGHMMWAGYTPVAGTAPPAPAPYPYGAYGFSVVPAAGPALAAPAFAAPPLARPAPPAAARQYVCPSCGAVGLPRWTAAGQPQCPVCGGLMSVAPLRWEAELAAAP